MDFLGKEYTLVREENFDGFLRSAGLPDDKIAILTTLTQSEKMIKNSDNTYTVINTTSKGSRESTFSLGVQFEETVGLGDVVKTTYNIDGDTVTQLVKGQKGTATMKKQYKGDELVVTITSDNWDGIAHRYYKA